ncbi:MAG: pilus assembly protein PilP [Gemmatimonadetes bacterium]|nr:pilus assembly protein PilP [Gemmatimonadota bacterium]
MRAESMTRFAVVLGLGVVTALAAAQQDAEPSAAPQPQDAAPAVESGEIQLMFEREVFTYPGDNRRDPFKSLAESEGMGPLFDDLSLRMIIHSPVAGQSVALVADGGKKVYRLRRGDVIGNATVVDITATRVVFNVEDFGNRRQEVLDLKAQTKKEGA